MLVYYGVNLYLRQRQIQTTGFQHMPEGKLRVCLWAAPDFSLAEFTGKWRGDSQEFVCNTAKLCEHDLWLLEAGKCFDALSSGM